MPLTIAHPALVLPFRHSRLPLSALVIGSLSPDFEYFLHLAPRSAFSHTAAGLFTFCLPAGLIALWLYHRIWKRPLMAMIEGVSAEHFKPFHFRPLSRLFMLCSAILFGALLHVSWDSFTQDYGWLVEHVGKLRREVSIADLFEMPAYLILQHLSTLAGIGFLIHAALHHRKWTWAAVIHRWPLLVVAGWISIAGGIALGMLVAGDVSTREGLLRWLGCGMVVGSLILACIITFFSMLWHLNHHRPGSVI